MKILQRLLFKFIFLFPLLCASQGPGFTWANNMGGSLQDVAYSVFVDAGGNVLSTGDFQGTSDFDPGPGTYTATCAGNNDIFISKLDANGNFLWAATLGSTGYDNAYCIKSDASGNVYVAGDFSGTVDFDPGPGVYTLSPVLGTNAYILKLSSSGNFLWAVQLAGSTSAKSLTLDAAGNIFSTGLCYGQVDYDPGPGTYTLTGGAIYVHKMNSSGNFVWAQQFNGTGGRGTSIGLDVSGNVFVGGKFSGTVDFDPGPGTYTRTSYGSNDIFVCKLDNSGNFSWAAQMGGTLDDLSNSLALDGSGNIYACGSFQGTADFDPGVSTYTMSSIASGNDLFISKLDNSGNFVWAKQCSGNGSEYASGIFITASGGIFLTGAFNYTVDFDPGPSSEFLSSSGTAMSDIFILELNAAGNFQFARAMGSAYSDEGNSIYLDNANNIYIAGYFMSTADFDPGPLTYNITSGGGGNSWDIFTEKFCFNAGASITANGSTSLCPGSTIMLTAGPATSYSWNTGPTTQSIVGNGGGNYYAMVTNSTGCNVWTNTITLGVNPSPTITAPSGSICAGASFSIQCYWAATYTVTGGSFLVSPSVTTSYSVVGTSSAGCLSQNTAVCTVTVVNQPLPTIAVNSGSICSGYGFSIQPSGANTYTISGGQTWVSPSVTTQYSVTGTGTNGCVSASPAIATVSVNPMPTISINSGTICSGNSFTLMGAGANTYTYQGGSAVVSPSATSVYSVLGTTTAGCTGASQATVTVKPTPTITVNSGTICTGASFTILPGGANTYSISGANSIVSPTSNTTYSVSGTSTNGCVSSNPALCNVMVNPLPNVQAACNETFLCSGQSATLLAGGANAYTWTPGGTGPIIVVTPTVTTVYTLTGIDANGCVGTAVITESVDICNVVTDREHESSPLIFPNPFTDFIYLKSEAGNEIEIYNTLGQRIFFGRNENKIDTRSFAPGFYYLRTEKIQTKIIKEK